MLRGRVRLRQPRGGYRAAIDPVLLAAAVPAASRRVIDLGCGAGAASLCVLARVSEISILGAELDVATAALARENISLNNFNERADVIVADIRNMGAEVASAVPERFANADCVIANPPFLDAARADPPVEAGRRRSRIEGTASLIDWVDAVLRLARPRGWIVFVHRADRVPELLAAFAGRAGDIAIFPLWPKAGVPAKRVLVGARPGMRSPARLLPGLVLHRDDGGYTDAAEAALGGGAIELWPSAA